MANTISSSLHYAPASSSGDLNPPFQLNGGPAPHGVLVAGRDSPVNRHDIAPVYPSWEAFMDSWRLKFNFARVLELPLSVLYDPKHHRATAVLTAYRHEPVAVDGGKPTVRVIFEQDSVLARDIIRDLDDATPGFIKNLVIVSPLIPTGRRNSKYKDRVIMVVPPVWRLR